MQKSPRLEQSAVHPDQPGRHERSDRHETVQDRAERFHHPAPFPATLAEMCIRLHGINKQPIVVDPFAGIGSTLMAAARLELRGIGIDSNKTYCMAARDRLL
jgi:site-specific DNA-methyltransferase (adenine-specific)